MVKNQDIVNGYKFKSRGVLLGAPKAMIAWQINLMRNSAESSILNSNFLTVLDQWGKERHRSSVVEDFAKEKWGEGRDLGRSLKNTTRRRN